MALEMARGTATVDVAFSPQVLMSRKALTTVGHVFNMSFGDEPRVAIEFILPIDVSIFRFDLEITIRAASNISDAERFLEKAHASWSKQQLGYNPYQSCLTGEIEVRYSDHSDFQSYALNEVAKDAIYRDLSYFFSFLQRRRVLFANLHLDPSSRLMTFPIQAAAEYMDAVAFGVPAVRPEDSAVALCSYLEWRARETKSPNREFRGLLVRMNNLLNLPYAYERAEGYWRIVEAAGSQLADTPEVEVSFNAVKQKLGMKKNSGTLKSVIRVVVLVDKVDIDQIASAFNFRNAISHEFLNFDLIGASSAHSAMNYLQEVCETYVAHVLAISPLLFSKPNSSVIFGRVV